MKKLLILVLFSLLSSAFGDVKIPPLNSRVTDLSGILSSNEINSITGQLVAIENETNAQIAVLILPSTQPEEIEQYSIRVAEKWKTGHKDHDNGVILIAAMNDRRFRIEVGYGLEGVLTDAFCNTVITKGIIPQFRNQSYAGGIQLALSEIQNQLKGDPLLLESQEKVNYKGSKKKPFSRLVLIIAFIAVIIGKATTNKWVKFIIAAVIGLAIFIITTHFIITIFITAVALLIILFGNNGGRGGGGYHSRGGYIGGTGFGGGGFSGGGFSGGGGSFGGGGASGSW